MSGSNWGLLRRSFSWQAKGRNENVQNYSAHVRLNDYYDDDDDDGVDWAAFKWYIGHV